MIAFALRLMGAVLAVVGVSTYQHDFRGAVIDLLVANFVMTVGTRR